MQQQIYCVNEDFDGLKIDAVSPSQKYNDLMRLAAKAAVITRRSLTSTINPIALRGSRTPQEKFLMFNEETWCYDIDFGYAEEYSQQLSSGYSGKIEKNHKDLVLPFLVAHLTSMNFVGQAYKWRGEILKARDQAQIANYTFRAMYCSQGTIFMPDLVNRFPALSQLDPLNYSSEVEARFASVAEKVNFSL